MSYLNKMYGRQSKNTAPASDKNPNRITCGLRAQGVDVITVLVNSGVARQERAVKQPKNQST